MSDPLEAIQAGQHQILKEVRAINGLVQRHEEELFGCPDKQTAGVKSDVEELKVFAIQAKTVIKIAIAVVAFFGATNILLLIQSTGS